MAEGLSDPAEAPEEELLAVAPTEPLGHIVLQLRQFAVPIESLVIDPDNARIHGPRNLDAIEGSLRAFGQRLPIIVQKQGMIVRVGNGRVEVARDRLGWTHIAALVVDESDVDAVRYSLADNRTAELADWDVEGLTTLLEDLAADIPDLDMDYLQWSDLGEVLPDSSPPAPEPQLDRATELQRQWNVKRGQMWRIPSATARGKAHRVMCGDSTSTGDVGVLMAGERASLGMTSPPYWLGKEYEREKTRAEVPQFQASIASVLSLAVREDESRMVLNVGTYWKSYVDGGKRPIFGLLLDEWVAVLADVGWYMRHCRIWAKQAALPHTSPTSDLVDTHWEFIATFYRPDAKYRGQQRCGQPWAQQGIWDKIQGTANAEGHCAAYPVEIPARNVELYSVRGELVFDPFLGSGTTMVAAEQLGRVCYSMEIESLYVAVSLQRMTDMGLRPELADD